MSKGLKYFLQTSIPLLLAGLILWWMYRGIEWGEISSSFNSWNAWTWMLLSFPFGISAQIFRALRWRQALAPLGEKPRLMTCVNAIFLSYASSLAIPRIGEVLRCGVLTRYEGTNMSKSIGTVVTERVVDMVLILLFALIVLMAQIPVFIRFFDRTGVTLQGFLQGFTTTGYLVVAVCMVVVLLMTAVILHKMKLLTRTRSILDNLRDGLLSVRHVDSPSWFIVYSVGIWASYFLHFYLTFFCFDFTKELGISVAMVTFVISCFAVIVPTPNGAGPWHFAVKTILMLYGIDAIDGALFALIVHSLQTLLVVLLGLFSIVSLLLTRPLKKSI